MRAFSKEDPQFLKEFFKKLPQEQIELFNVDAVFSEDKFRKIFHKWGNSIQFSELRASVKPVPELIREISAIFIGKGIKEAQAALQNKHQVFHKAWKELKNAMNDRFGKSGMSLLKQNYALTGKIEKHEFDLAIVNGTPYAGALALSFKVRDSLSMRKDVDAAAFAFDDVKKGAKSISLALIVDPPKGSNVAYSRAKHVFKTLKVPMVASRSSITWAKKIVGQLPNHLDPAALR